MNELGNVNISQEVVATIAESVISEIEGVNSLVGGTSKMKLLNFSKMYLQAEKESKWKLAKLNVH